MGEREQYCLVKVSVKTLINSGPVFVFVACNRFHYQKSFIF